MWTNEERFLSELDFTPELLENCFRKTKAGSFSLCMLLGGRLSELKRKFELHLYFSLLVTLSFAQVSALAQRHMLQ